MKIEVPQVTFKTRVGDMHPAEGGCAIGGEWVDVTTDEIFKDKLVIIFSLPGAYTPTCSTYQLPGFEEQYEDFKALGVDEIYCVSVNDSFVMNAWAEDLGIKNVKVLPDGNGEFTEGMGYLVDKSELGFGKRSWRYAAIINNGQVVVDLPESTASSEPDPYGESSPENVMKELQEYLKEAA